MPHLSESERQDARDRRRARRNELRDEIEHQFEHARDQFEEANEKIKQRTGRDLILAIITGAFFGLVVVGSLVFWKWIFVGVVSLVVLLGVYELARAFRENGRRIDTFPQLLGASGILAAAAFGQSWMLWVAVVAAVVLVAGWRVVAQAARKADRAAKDALADVLYGGLIPVYVAFLASLTIVLVSREDGEWWVLAFVVVVVSVDTGAYAVGLTFGKHPMAPKISPKKTWEGFAGAVVAAVIAGMLLGIYMLGLPWWAGLIFGLAILMTATAGDLAESMIKRDLGIKDISSWVPGHGGLLDRLDSILPSAPAALLLSHLLPIWAGGA
jgi:phosphatidate cytidylyltransferase